MLSFIAITIVGLATQLAYIDCTRCVVEGRRNTNCGDGCLYLYTTSYQMKQECYVRNRLNKYIGENHCHRAVRMDRGTTYTFGCRCTDSHCNNRAAMLIQAACTSVFPLHPDERSLYGRINTCECARNNPIACSRKQSKMNRLCSGSDKTCPANVPDYGR